MKGKMISFISLVAAIAAFLQDIAFAAGEKAAAIVIVADTRRLSGLMAWWGNLYNESHFLFMLLTVAIIPVIGVVFGVVADLVMSYIGIDLKSRELAEH